MVGTTSMKATKSSHDGVNDDDHYGGSKCTDDFKTLLSAMSMIVKEVPSLIIQIIKSTEEKRTLLNTIGMDCVMLALECSAMLCKIKSINENEMKRIVDLIWDSLPMLRTLLQVKSVWSTTNSKSNKESGTICTERNNFSPALMKKQCADVIIRDWVQVFDRVENHYNQCRILHSDEGVSAKFLLVDEIAGSLIEDKSKSSTYMSLGGIAQSLVSHYDDTSSKSKVDDFLIPLRASVHFMNAEENGTKIHLSNELFDSFSRQIIHCLRGACTWICRKKHALDYLQKTSSTQEAVDLCLMMFQLKSERSLNHVLSIL